MNCKLLKVTAFAVTIFSLLSCSSNFKKLNQHEIKKHNDAMLMHKLILEDNLKKEKAVREFISNLSLEEKLSQVFMINLEKDDEFLPVEWYQRTVKNFDGSVSEIKTTLIPAGYIFFGYNVSKNPEQIIGFTDSIYEHATAQSSIPPFISIDAEGGFVNRLRGVAGPLPENQRVAECLTPDGAYDLYSYYAMQMNALGFNLNLAPVTEICTEKNQDFLSGRSYGNLEKVSDYSVKAIKAYQNNSVGTVIKHFPGNTNIDPHVGLPKIEMTSEEFDQMKKVFSLAVLYNPDGVLMSHAIVPQYDEVPACLSKFWITDIMRNELKYDGIIFSDDIFMGALIDNGYSPAKASRMAVDAGINCIMISEKKFGRWMNLLSDICKDDPMFLEKIEDSVYKMLCFKIRHNLVSLDYDKVTDKYSVRLFDKNNSYKVDSIDERFEFFSEAKAKTCKIYDEYFRDSSDADERRGLYIE